MSSYSGEAAAAAAGAVGEEVGGGGDMGDEDEDVVWEGSPLHKHLEQEGLLAGEEDMGLVEKKGAAASTAPVRRKRSRRRPPPATSKGLCARFPSHSAMVAQLEVEVARRVLDSELLVQEDEDFVGNFILTEEALELARKRQEELEAAPSRSSGLGDVLLLSGSLAAAAAAVLYLSERARLAATVASVLPTAVAAVSAAGEWAKGSEEADG